MADENIVVSVTDSVAPTIARNLTGISSAARDAYSSVQALQKALDGLNVGNLNSAINGVNSATSQLGGTINNTSNSTQNFSTQLNQLNAQFNSLSQTTTTVNNSFVQITQNVNSAGSGVNAAGANFVIFGAALRQAIGYLEQFGQAVETLVEWRAQSDRVRIGIEQVSGSAEAAAANSQFLSTTINKLGLDMNATTNSFIKFAASTQGTILQGEKTQQIFTSISEAAAVLHLTADQTQSVFLALEQMASKGTVSMQELRLQLANALPGALGTAAQAMGKTTAEFEQMVSKGEVVSDEFLPKFAQAIHDKYAGAVEDASQSAQGSLNRFGNAWTDLARTIGASKLGDAAKSALDGVTEQIDLVTRSIKNFQSMSWGQIFKYGVANGVPGQTNTTNNSSTNLTAAQLAQQQQQLQTANLNKFLNTGKMMTPAETLKKNQDELKAEFDAATKGMIQESTQYLQAYATYQDRLAALNQKAAAPGIKAAHKQFENELTAQMTALEATGTQAKNLYAQQTADLQTALANQQITQAQYIVQLGADKQAELTTLRNVAQQEADLATGKDQLAARQKYLNQVKDLNAQMVTNALDTQKQLAQLAAKTTQDANKILAQLNLSAANQNAQNDNSLTGLSTGSQQLQDLQQLQNIMKTYAAARSQFTQQAMHDGTQYSVEYIKGINDINVAEQAQLANEKVYFQQRDQMTSDWTNGFNQGIQNIITQSGNVAQQTSSLVTSSFDSMSESLANLAVTGKLSFTSLVQTILAGMIKIQLQAAASTLLQTLFGSATSFAGSFGTTATGAYGFNTGTSTATTGGSALMGLTGSVGFASGGYTGNAGTQTPVGIVHGQEFVVNAQATRQPGVLSMLTALNSGKPGYSSGGYVGTLGTPALGGSNGSGVNVQVNVNNTVSDKASVSVQHSTGADGSDLIDIVVSAAQNQIAGDISAGQGPVHNAVQNRFGLRPNVGR